MANGTTGRLYRRGCNERTRLLVSVCSRATPECEAFVLGMVYHIRRVLCVPRMAAVVAHASSAWSLTREGTYTNNGIHWVFRNGRSFPDGEPQWHAMQQY